MTRELKSGFTLIELLVVVVILGGVIAAVGACLSAGIRAWEAAENFGARDTDVALFLELLERDIAGANRFFDLAFQGSESSIAIPTACLKDESGQTFRQRIGTIKYWFEPRKNCLFRRQWPYPLQEPSEQDAIEAVLGDVRGVTFSYLSMKKEGEDVWMSGWTDPTNFPLAVRATIRVGLGTEEVTRTMRIPTALLRRETK